MTARREDAARAALRALAVAVTAQPPHVVDRRVDDLQEGFQHPSTTNLGVPSDAGAVPTLGGPDRVRTSGGRCGQAEHTHDIRDRGAPAIGAPVPGAEHTAAHTPPLRCTRV